MTAPTDHFETQFAPFAGRMAQENLPAIAIETFAWYYRQFLNGQTGLIAERDIEPVQSLPNAADFSEDLRQAGQTALSRLVLIKLNGGLGTGMGLDQAKSLLVVKNGLTFLDIIARQALNTGVPLVLMNSFATRADSLAALNRYPELNRGLPLDFMQHKIPKINRQTGQPVAWPANPELEWCPPGHGDIYTALITSGILDALLEKGYCYAFVSNADNLGAVADPAILGYFAQNNLPFMMEVADRTPADKKGGHLAQYPGGQFLLRESAQCPAEDSAAFQDIRRHKYFNTNNLWINLPALKRTLSAQDNILGLPLIRNAKTVDPKDATSTPVYQLETAMGSAIAIFKGAGAVRVPRSRFAPVKTTSDLLVVRSDAYILTDDFHVMPNVAGGTGPDVVELDPHFYRLSTDLDIRFPFGPPSLCACRRLSLQGDIRFGGNVTIRGAVHLENTAPEPLEISAGSILTGPI